MSAICSCGRICEAYLLLHQFELLCFQQLLWYTLWASLRAKTEVPEFLAELWCVFIEEAGKLDLKDFDFGLYNL